MLHNLWLPYSNYEFIYEDFMLDPLNVITDILTFLGMKFAG
jgi:hypothetical protein